jgi:hypothetical protein
MPTIKEDIEKFSEMMVKGFSADKLTLDYTLTSFKDIETFYNKHSKDGKAVEGGRFSKNLGPILFGLGGYIGKTIIKLVPGTKWIIDEKDKEGEVNAALQLPDGSMVWPMQRTIKRFRNGEEDNIYYYGYAILKDHLDIEKLLADEQQKRSKKSIWKFWK